MKTARIIREIKAFLVFGGMGGLLAYLVASAIRHR